MPNKKIKIKQIKSLIGRSKKQRDTMQALGIKRINHTVEHTITPQISGMIKKVNHLVSVEEA